jgi:hypothetical protein
MSLNKKIVNYKVAKLFEFYNITFVISPSEVSTTKTWEKQSFTHFPSLPGSPRTRTPHRRRTARIPLAPALQSLPHSLRCPPT